MTQGYGPNRWPPHNRWLPHKRWIPHNRWPPHDVNVKYVLEEFPNGLLYSHAYFAVDNKFHGWATWDVENSMWELRLISNPEHVYARWLDLEGEEYPSWL